MTKYKYVYDASSGIVNRSLIATYPDISIVDRSISSNKNTTTITKELEQASIGIAESRYIVIEENWYVQQQLVEKLTAEYATNKLSETLSNLKIAMIARATLENTNKWLLAYRGEETTVTRPTITVNIPTDQVKKIIAYERDTTVRTNEDSIADLAKMNALLMAMCSGMYGVLSDTQKSKIDAEKRGLIEYAIVAWNKSSTRADRQLATEGTALIDKLFAREVAIADIVDKITTA